MTTTPIPNILTSRVQSFTVGGIDFSGQAASASIQAKTGDFRPLGKPAPENDYTVEITAGQDLTTQSLWYLMFTQTNTQVEVILKPYGNDDAPTEDMPWVSTTAWVSEPSGDLVGGGAEASTTAKRTFAVSWVCSRPVLVTTAP